MTTRADLFREYARVIDMCEGTEVYPAQCVKINGIPCVLTPTFENSENNYSFALAIVEGKPVFDGDELFSDLSSQKDRHLIAARLSGNRIMMTDGGIFCLSDLSWNPPKRKTFMLNGEELPMPDGEPHMYPITINSIIFMWKNKADRDSIEQAIIRMLKGE
jgi:hypothetical protein